ncbi:MAG: BatA and WFA domain-containing protein [Verrucomicrobiota bacterium]|nr:BatA and WFA domain-containing protein [Verrucomicrobiota bacterium]
MNWGGFHTPAFAWLFLLFIPLVLFYFLKLKRPRQVIPSLALWRQVLQDRRVNAPFQKFKRNILLILQLLLLLLLVLAALQPFWRGNQGSGTSRRPIIIDCSASMAAKDHESGKTRLEHVKEKVAAIINGLGPGQELSLITFTQYARKRTEFTGNKTTLHKALKEIEVEDVPANVEDALRLCQALAKRFTFNTVLLFSDGNFAHSVDVDLSFTLDYQRIPFGGDNMGITACNAVSNSKGEWSVFVQVEGSSKELKSAKIEIIQDGVKKVEDSLLVGKERAERIALTIPGSKASTIEVKLVPEGEDVLATDNQAWLQLPLNRPLLVYVNEAMSAYKMALKGIPGIAVVTDKVKFSAADLVITDDPNDKGILTRTALWVGTIPEALKKQVTVKQENAAVVDWMREAKLLQHVALDDVIVLDNPQAPDVRDEVWENEGYRVLVSGAQGPLLLEKNVPGNHVYYMLFHSDRSTLPYRIAFPILIANLIEEARHDAGLSETLPGRTGVVEPQLGTVGGKYTFEGPGVRSTDVTADEAGMISGLTASKVGVYKIKGATETKVVTASLLSSSETRLDAVEKIQFKETLSVAASGKSEKADVPLWTIMAGLAFLMVLIEWWYYQRRPEGVE